MPTIRGFQSRDVRYELLDGAGSDAVHTDPQYGYAVTLLETDTGLLGTGLSYTLGGGTDLVCHAIELLAPHVLGHDLETLMASFGSFQKGLADHHQLRWLGPHKGVIHAALASLTNACFDLWAKSRRLPLWKLLLELTPQQLVALLDLSYCEDVLTAEEAIGILERHRPTRHEREGVLRDGYPGYDTSVGWLKYDNNRLRANVENTLAQGFGALKLKVGSPDLQHDLERARLLREVAGPDVRIMLDANQAWSVPQAMRACLAFAEINPFWIEEPTHPDDVQAHRALALAARPTAIAVGEAVPNRVSFKNFLEANAVGIVQADCTRLAGISEYLVVALMARQYSVKVVPHVGDMGQIHQHLVLFNHIALGHEKVFLEYIPHLREYFMCPAEVKDGVYVPPAEPGASTDLKPGRGNADGSGDRHAHHRHAPEGVLA